MYRATPIYRPSTDGLMTGYFYFRTLVFDSRETGMHVVEDVINRFNTSGWETNEKVLQFLNRIALVESGFGQDGNTFRDGYYGGIWQVDEENFDDTKNITSERLDVVLNLFEINWITTTWMDLVKPLYSGIAARLYLSIQPTPIPSDLADQAKYWKMYYNNGSATNEDDFIMRVEESGGRYGGG